MFKVGDRVRLKEKKETAVIEALLSGIYEGGVKLDRKLENFSYWNVDDLEIVLPQN